MFHEMFHDKIENKNRNKQKQKEKKKTNKQTKKNREMLEIKPLAFDSFGVRSMATFVESSDIRILIDAGVSLAPLRYNLAPHQTEEKRMRELWSEIVEVAEDADVLIVTHYHYDHYNPQNPEIYRDKVVYVKDPAYNINKSQHERAEYFIEMLKGVPRSLETADGHEFRHGSTTIKFSNAVFHGTDRRLGFVVEVCIACGGEKFVYTSDVEGPSLEEQVSFVLSASPDVVFVDGPMTYMLGYRYSKRSLERSIENLKRIVDVAEKVVIDHHLLRDLNYRERIADVYAYASDKNAEVLTAAEFAGRPIEMLEARRKELYEQDRQHPGLHKTG